MQINAGRGNNNYYGPGTNVWPAIKYLRSQGAISQATAISLDQIESQDFRELLKLNVQTSGIISITPEGKYWVKLQWLIIALVIFGIMTVGTVIFAITIFSKFNKNRTDFELIKPKIDKAIENFESSDNTIQENQVEKDSIEVIEDNTFEEQKEAIEQDLEEFNQLYEDTLDEMGL